MRPPGIGTGVHVNLPQGHFMLSVWLYWRRLRWGLGSHVALRGRTLHVGLLELGLHWYAR